MAYKVLAFIYIALLPTVTIAQENNSEEYAAIIKYCSEKIKEEPNNYFYYKGRADAELVLRDWDAAINDYSMALKLKNQDGDIFYNRGIALYEKKKFKLAEEDFLKAIAILKKLPEAQVYVGLINKANGDYEEAIINFTNAIRDSINYFEAYYNRGLSLSKMANYEKAIEDFTRAIDLRKNTNSEINVAYNYAKLKQFDVAESKINLLLQMDSTNASIYKYKGLIFIEKGDNASACNIFLKAKGMGASVDEDIKKYCK